MAVQPNFLIIMSDQHAPDVVGGLGDAAAMTPALDRLVAKGVSFGNAYCTYPMCTPSRASFMTGLLTAEHGVWELGSPLRSDIPTWAHVLRRAGYVTSISGRMHFVGHDKMHGFERRVHPELGDLLTPYAYGDWDQPQCDDHIMLETIQAAGPRDEPTRGERFDTDVVHAAIEELSHLTSGADPRPWALTVGMFLPHMPYAVSCAYYDQYEGVDIPPPRAAPNGNTFEQCVPPQMRGLRRWLGLTDDGMSDQQVYIARRCYYAMISHMDMLIGSLLDKLEQTGVGDNTWIIYLSDHGDNIGEHGFWSKLNFYEQSVRVPLIIVPPRCEHAGTSCDAPVSLIDWMSTIVAMTDQQDAFDRLAGRSLLPLLKNPVHDWHDRVIICDYACDGTRVPMRMVRRGKWKACFAEGFSPMLFDLQKDPHEWNDLGDDVGSQAILDDLRTAAGADGRYASSLTGDVLHYKRQLRFISEAED